MIQMENIKLNSFRDLKAWQKAADSGYTLIELLVAIGLFLVVVTIAVGGFTRALRTQRQVQQLIAAQSNVSLAIEQMAREIRTGTNFCDGTVVDGASMTCSSVTDPVELKFRNALGKIVAYRLKAGAIERGVRDVVGGTVNFQKITGENANIQYLNFRLFGNRPGSDYPPRITISLGVSPRGDVGISSVTVDLQTTVSARNIPL